MNLIEIVWQDRQTRKTAPKYYSEINVLVNSLIMTYEKGVSTLWSIKFILARNYSFQIDVNEMQFYANLSSQANIRLYSRFLRDLQQ